MLRDKVIKRIRSILGTDKETDEELLIIFLDEFKNEFKETLERLQQPVTLPTPEIKPEIEIPPIKVELEKPPLERPIRTFSRTDVVINGTEKFFKVDGAGELIFFTIVSTSENYSVKVEVDNITPPSYNNKTYSQYTLTAEADPHLSADDDVIDGETVYKTTIKKLPFRKSCAGYVVTSEAVTFKVIEAQLAII